MNWLQLITFSEYWMHGHTLDNPTDLYVIRGNSIEVAKGHDKDRPIGRDINTHNKQWPNDNYSHKGRIDHKTKVISLMPKKVFNRKRNDFAKEILSKKYPDYTIHEFNADLVNFEEKESYFDLGHQGNSHIYRYKDGKLETIEAKHAFVYDDPKRISHGKSFNEDMEEWDVKGRIDHNRQKISVAANRRKGMDQFHPKVDYVKKQLLKKYPNYQLIDYNADLCFASFDDNLGNKIHYHINPSKEKVKTLMENLWRVDPNRHKLRGILDHSTGKSYIYPAFNATHDEFADKIGLSSNDLSLERVYLTKALDHKDKYRVGISNGATSTPSGAFHFHPFIKSLNIDDRNLFQ